MNQTQGKSLHMAAQNTTDSISIPEYIGSNLIIVVGCIGFFGNIAAIIYFGQKKYRSKSFFVLFACLGIFDNIYLIAKLCYSSAIYNVSTTLSSLMQECFSMNYCKFTYIGVTFGVHMFGVTGSILFTISICIERYITICKPFRHNSRPINWKRYVSGVMLFTITLNVTFWICNLFLEPEEYAIIMLISLFLVPSVILIAANVLIVRTLIKSTKMICTSVPNDTNTGGRLRISSSVNLPALPKSISQSLDRVSSSGNLQVPSESVPQSLDRGIQPPMDRRVSQTSQIESQAKLYRQRKMDADLAIISLIVDVVFVVSQLFNAITDIYNIIPPKYVLISDFLVVMNSSVNFYIFMVKQFVSKDIR